MRIALVRDGVVENVIVADENYAPEQGILAVTTEVAGPGWIYDGESFAPPSPAPAPVPDMIERWRAKAILRSMPGTTEGQTLLDEANALVAASGDPVLAEFWASATMINRRSPTLVSLAAALGLGEMQLDDMFRAAAAIEL